MEILIASLQPDEVRLARSLGVRTIITNPAVLAATGRDWADQLVEAMHIVGGQVHLQVTAKGRAAILRQVDWFEELCGDRLIVKLPFTRDALEALPDLQARNAAVNLTGVVTVAQAVAALTAQPACVSVYVGRADAAGRDGVNIVQQLDRIVRRRGLPTRVIAASVRTPDDFVNASIAGADAAACSASLLRALVDDDLTERSMRDFDDDWASIIPTESAR